MLELYGSLLTRTASLSELRRLPGGHLSIRPVYGWADARARAWRTAAAIDAVRGLSQALLGAVPADDAQWAALRRRITQLKVPRSNHRARRLSITTRISGCARVAARLDGVGLQFVVDAKPVPAIELRSYPKLLALLRSRRRSAAARAYLDMARLVRFSQIVVAPGHRAAVAPLPERMKATSASLRWSRHAQTPTRLAKRGVLAVNEPRRPTRAIHCAREAVHRGRGALARDDDLGETHQPRPCRDMRARCSGSSPPSATGQQLRVGAQLDRRHGLGVDHELQADAASRAATSRSQKCALLSDSTSWRDGLIGYVSSCVIPGAAPPIAHRPPARRRAAPATGRAPRRSARPCAMPCTCVCAMP